MNRIVQHDPFRDLRSFRNAVNRLFDETVGRTGSPFAVPGSPAIDLHPMADAVVVKAALPGVCAQDLTISITCDVLLLRGKGQADDDIQGAQYPVKVERIGGS